MRFFKQRLIGSLLSILFLSTGSLIYILFRPKNLIMFKWFRYFQTEDFISISREKFSEIPINDFVIYNLPNGLWITSLTIFISIIWKDSQNKYFNYYLLTLLGIVTLPEILQFFNFINGTFDIVDLMVNFLFFLIPFDFLNRDC